MPRCTIAYCRKTATHTITIVRISTGEVAEVRPACAKCGPWSASHEDRKLWIATVAPIETPPPVDIEPMITAWSAGVETCWPEHKPEPVADLLRIRDSLPYAAPEDRGRLARRAWELYRVEGDTAAGRAAVALAHLAAA